jgi:S-DNA-T family DNA segregation ATPase FtsK/SpoIIIE
LKKSTAVPSPVPLWRQQLHYRLKEGALIAFGALCLYLMMALLTYDQNDPGWSHTSSSVEVQNAAGRAGAFCADILFMVLGYFAYIFPLLLAVKVLLAADRPGISGTCRCCAGAYPFPFRRGFSWLGGRCAG